MIRHYVITVLLVFISSIVGLVLGYAPGLFLAALMQGQGTEAVGIVANIMAVGGGILFPLKVFHQRLGRYSDSSVATGLLAIFMAVGLPIAWFILSDVLTDTSVGRLMGITAILLFVATPPTVGAALIALGMSGLELNRNRHEG